MASLMTLNRLLARLDHTVLSADADPQLQTSQYERSRVGANIEAARALLLTLEKQSATERIQSQRQQMQAELHAKREHIKRLNTRLRELNDAGLDESEEDDEDDEEGEGENVLDTYGPARTDADAGLEVGEKQTSRIDEEQQQTLRARKVALQAGDNRSAASTTAREQLFAARPKEDLGTTEVQQTETLMSHNRTQQEALTEGMIGLARALKESSLQFGASLEAEKDVMKRAEGGLDKSAQGMEAAEQKMSMLRRMSEGQGWWGRIKLYGFIAGLWVACFLLVFIGPKLRF